MTNINDFLATLPGRLQRLQEKPILGADGAPAGWHSNAISESGEILGSGTAPSRDESRRIAVAEFIERSLFKKICGDAKLRAQFWIDEDSSTSGFAAGFARESTRFRSFAEAVERWAWTKWIDDAGHVPEIPTPLLSPMAKGLLSHFDAVEYRQIALPIEPGWTHTKLFFNVILGFHGNGVFPGSRVTSAADDGWTHGAVESWRNFNNFKILSAASTPLANVPPENQWIDDRTLYFGENADVARRQFSGPAGGQWPTAKLRGMSEYQTGHAAVFLWRALCLEYSPWQAGGIKRFIY